MEVRTQKIRERLISRPFNYVYMPGFVAMGDVWAALCGVGVCVNLKPWQQFYFCDRFIHTVPYSGNNLSEKFFENLRP